MSERSPQLRTRGHANDDKASLPHPHAENWVLEERRLLAEAERARQEWWRSLRLHPRERIPLELVRELARIDTDWQYVRRGAA